jgi:hypothetical protein
VAGYGIYSYRPGIYIAKNIYETANEFPTMVNYIVERNKFHQTLGPAIE